MLKDALAVWTHQTFASAILWVLLLGILTYLFARDKYGALLWGLLRILASLVYSPVVYLRRATLSLCSFGQRGEALYATTEQYLLNKLMLTLQAGVVLLSIASLAAGLVLTWNDLLPPKLLRMEIRDLKRTVEDSEKQLAETNTEVARLDTAWARVKDGVMRAYRQERESAVQASSAELTRIASLVPQGSNLAYYMNQLRDATQPGQYENSRQGIESAHGSLRNQVDQMWSATSEDLQQLYSWCDNWQKLTLAKLELAEMSEDQMRTGHQPDYPSLIERRDELVRSLDEQKARLDNLRQQAHPRLGLGLLELIRTLVVFLAVLWIQGLVIELLSLVIRLAGDVREIRLGSPTDPSRPSGST